MPTSADKSEGLLEFAKNIGCSPEVVICVIIELGGEDDANLRGFGSLCSEFGYFTDEKAAMSRVKKLNVKYRLSYLEECGYDDEVDTDLFELAKGDDVWKLVEAFVADQEQRYPLHTYSREEYQELRNTLTRFSRHYLQPARKRGSIDPPPKT